MMMEDFLCENYDLIYGLKIIGEEMEYRFLDRYGVERRELELGMNALYRMHELIVDTLLERMNKYQKTIDEHYGEVLEQEPDECED